MTCLPRFIVTFIVVYSVCVADEYYLGLQDSCSYSDQCDTGLACDNGKCRIEYGSSYHCSSSLDCVIELWCIDHYTLGSICMHFP
uniref:Gsp_47 putative toxin n=1 Tax=Gemmula speciosa TaxID=439592 RepID=A0A098LW97_GEMSP